MYLKGGDFDIEDRVSATEGEAIVMGEAIFGNYDEDVYGEIEAYDVLSLGDFDDAETFGRSKSTNRRVKKYTKKPVARVVAPAGRHLKVLPARARAGLPPQAKAFVKAPTSSLQTMPVVVAPAKGKPKRRRRGFAFKPRISRPKISVPRISAPKVSIPKMARGFSSIPVVRADVAAQQIRNTGGVQSVASVSRPSQLIQMAAHGNKEGVTRPISQAAQVVAPAGASLTSQSLAPSQVIQTVSQAEKQAVQAGVQAASRVVSIQAGISHPLVMYSTSMGYEDETLGFSLSDFLNKAKADAQAALNKAVEDAKTKAKEAAGTFLAQQSSKIVSDPKIQSLAKQEAEKAATMKLAETLRSPETKEKAKQGAMIVGAALAAFIAYKMLRSRQAVV